METVLHINASFKCVYLLNGSFVEKADTVKCRFNEPVYITVLPLNAQHLPYTVKLLNGKALSNEQLVSVYTLAANHYYAKFNARYNYIYSADHKPAPTISGGAESFFFFVKQGNLPEARRQLTTELNSSIDDDSLRAFFDEYSDILENKFTPSPENSYYLINKDNNAVLFNFVLKGKLIDNIIQI